MREGDIFVWHNVVVSRVSDVSTTIKMDARIKSAHSQPVTVQCDGPNMLLSLFLSMKCYARLQLLDIRAAEIIPKPN